MLLRNLKISDYSQSIKIMLKKVENHNLATIVELCAFSYHAIVELCAFSYHVIVSMHADRRRDLH